MINKLMFWKKAVKPKGAGVRGSGRFVEIGGKRTEICTFSVRKWGEVLKPKEDETDSNVVPMLLSLYKTLKLSNENIGLWFTTATQVYGAEFHEMMGRLSGHDPRYIEEEALPYEVERFLSAFIEVNQLVETVQRLDSIGNMFRSEKA